MKTAIKLVCSVIFLLSFGASASEPELCRDLFFESDQHQALTFFLKFRNDYLPFKAKRITRKIDKYDLLLMERSYASGDLNRPIEMGLVELLDKDGNVLDYEILQGGYQHVFGLTVTSERLLRNNEYQLSKIHTIRRRHTHPKELYSKIIPEAFSEGDITNDSRFRASLNAISEFRHIRLEAYIVYLNIDLRTHLPEDLVEGDVKTRGYLVK